MLETIRWAYEAAVERILRKRLQERYDSGFLAGIDTAIQALKLANDLPQYEVVAEPVWESRRGYLEEVASR
jgi:hypothetical protein